jgi:hypothetical protein
MAHFAQIENGIVTNVIVVQNNELLIDGIENEQKGRQFCQNLFGGTWIQTSYNNNFRKQYAGIGFTYNSDADIFIAPQPYPSWSLDSNYDWQSPSSFPTDGEAYYWDEESLSWVPFPDAG